MSLDTLCPHRPGEYLADLPIVRLREADRPRLVAHFLALPDADRNCRFGAGCSDEAIERYAAGIDLARDCTLAICAADGRVVAVAHVPVAGNAAELGISVLPQFRRRGMAAALVQRAADEARRAGAKVFLFDFTSANAGMQRLAERMQMTTERHGAAWIACMRLAPPLAA